MKKLQHIYTAEYYRAIKKYEIMSFPGKWVEFEIILLSKISHTQKDIYITCFFPHIHSPEL
jgi:hypothetical protein